MKQSNTPDPKYHNHTQFIKIPNPTDLNLNPKQKIWNKM